MRSYLYLSLFISLALLASCHKGSIGQLPQRNFNEPSSEVKVYTEEDAQYVVEEPTETTLTLSSDIPDELMPKIGEIILMPMSEQTPSGFLGRVVSIDTVDYVRLQTEIVPLEEAFPNLCLDVSLNKMKNVELLDEDGTPLEFYLVDSDDTEEVADFENGPQTRADISIDKKKEKYTKVTEFDWEKKKLEIPIPESWVKKFTKEKIDLNGVIELSFEGSDFKTDNKDGESKYIDIDIHTRFTVGANVEGHIKQLVNDKDGKKEWTTPKLTFKGVIPIGPVTFPITVPISGKARVKGDFSTSLELRYNKYFRYHRVYKNGKWSEPEQDTPSVEKKSPWYISEFDASGEFSLGPNIEINIGVFTSKAGIGIEFYPNGYLKAEASISSLNPFDFNPEVEVGVGMEWRVYCRAELFGKKVEPFSMDLPDIPFLKRTLSLFPSISEFEVIGESSLAELSWLSDSYYFLEPLGVKTGAVLYEPDGNTIRETFYPDQDEIDRLGKRHYHQDVIGLQPGRTYYASPLIKWGFFSWKGEKQPIQTEGQYHLAFRCKDRDYDVITFDFPLREHSGSMIDYSMEANDYDGDAMRCHIVANLDSSTMTLSGTFDFYFYDNPNQQRVDGFSVSLADGDSGYVNCRKVVDNGGCTAALRVYRLPFAGVTSKNAKIYSSTGPSCNVGIYNPNYVVE